MQAKAKAKEAAPRRQKFVLRIVPSIEDSSLLPQAGEAPAAALARAPFSSSAHKLLPWRNANRLPGEHAADEQPPTPQCAAGRPEGVSAPCMHPHPEESRSVALAPGAPLPPPGIAACSLAHTPPNARTVCASLPAAEQAAPPRCLSAVHISGGRANSRHS